MFREVRANTLKINEKKRRYKEKLNKNFTIKKYNRPGQVAQLVGALSHTPKGCGFDYGQGTCLGCSSIPGQGTYKRQPICFSHRCASLFIPLSLKSIKTSHCVRIKNIYKITKILSTGYTNSRIDIEKKVS